MIPTFILAIEDLDDREFMTEIYRKYERILYSTAVKITDNYWDAQDVVQSVLVKIIQSKIPLLRSLPERKQINYLITACHNSAVNCVKKRKAIFDVYADNDSDSPDSDIPDNSPSLEDMIFIQEEKQLFLLIWDSLDDRTKYFLNARYILEQSTAEIATELHILQAQVRTYLSRARKKALVAAKAFNGTVE